MMGRNKLAMWVAMGLVLFGLASPALAAGKPLKVGYNSWIGLGAVWIAQEKGFFGKRGLEVELSPFAGPADTLPPLATGGVDVGLTTADTLLIFAATDDTPVRGFYITDTSSGADAIVARTSIAAPADLKGKTVAATPGQVNHMLLLLALEKAGLKESDVELQVMGADDAGAAFVAGKLDAAVTWEPWVTTAMSNGGHVIFSSKDTPNLILDVMATTASTLAQRKDDLVAFVQAVDEGEQYMHAHPQESLDILAKWLAVKPEDAKPMLDGVTIYGLKTNAQLFGDGATPAVFKPLTEVATFLKNSEAIATVPDLATLFDGSVIAAASEGK